MSDYSIAYTKLGNYIVSTVELPGAKKYSELFYGEILEVVGRYETMVFEVDAEGKFTDRDMNVCIRYKTRTEAVIGHENVVSEWSVETII